MLENQYRVVEAFDHDGVKYYQFDDQFKIPAGRGLCTLTIYEEFNQRCTREHLTDICNAVEKILSDPKKINIMQLSLIHKNLKERLNFALFPDHVYKLASVIFFDKNESPYAYDFEYNKKKIEKWKASGGMLDFFLKLPLKDLIPSLRLPKENAEAYFRTAEMIDGLHRSDLQEVLSSHA